MCGFCGFTGNRYNDESNTIIKKMSERIAHRGPDGEGLYVDDAISLGFRRLSFFDLEGGSQPMHSADNSLVIVFNGEIYNFREIRESLVAKGYTFVTDSDTEVLLNLYTEYSEGMLNHLRGMFALLIYNRTNGEIFAARDFFGIKPFYYGMFGGQLLFASEIKALLEHPDFVKELNLKALESYLSFQYSVLNETFFKGVFKLPPAHYLKFKDGEVTIKRYWQAEFTPQETPLDEIVDKIDRTIKESVEYHQRADVPIGAFLSNGFDSGYVVSVADNLAKTFTVGFDYEGFSEIEGAKSLSQRKGIENISKVISTDEFWDAMPAIQYYMDEPLADASAVALYFVCKLARQHVKGSLSGEGADEFFGGYEIYREPLDLAPITKLPMPVRRFLGFMASKIPFNIKGKNYLIRASRDVEERFIGNASVFTKQEREEILKSDMPSESTANITKPFYDKVAKHDDITKMQYLDIHLWLVGDILLKADKMSMANSFEARVPFLDKEVFAVASTLPVKYRVNKTSGKYALRLAASRHFTGLGQRKRLGFPVPTRKWLREDKYYRTVLDAFNKAFVSDFFHVDRLLTLLERHKQGRVDNSRKLWTVFMFIIWYEAFFREGVE